MPLTESMSGSLPPYFVAERASELRSATMRTRAQLLRESTEL
jgi:hypothetical protein